MDKPAEDQRLQASLVLFRMLLRAYPGRFRDEYGGHMLQVFQDCCRAALHQGRGAGLLLLWVHTLGDILASLVEQYSDLAVEMNRTKFTGISGLAFILGTLGFGGELVGSAFNENLFTGTGGAALVGSSMFLLTMGIVGFYVRYAPRVGWLGKSSLVFSALGGAASTLASVLIFFVEDGPWWNIWMLSMGVMYGFLASFGVEAIRTRPMKRGNLLPLLAGIWFPVLLLAGAIYQEVTGRWLEMNDQATGLVWALIFIPMLLLGYVVYHDRPAVQPTG